MIELTEERATQVQALAILQRLGFRLSGARYRLGRVNAAFRSTEDGWAIDIHRDVESIPVDIPASSHTAATLEAVIVRLTAARIEDAPECLGAEGCRDATLAGAKYCAQGHEQPSLAERIGRRAAANERRIEPTALDFDETRSSPAPLVMNGEPPTAAVRGS